MPILSLVDRARQTVSIEDLCENLLEGCGLKELVQKNPYEGPTQGKYRNNIDQLLR
jgi:hypothetical protein